MFTRFTTLSDKGKTRRYVHSNLAANDKLDTECSYPRLYSMAMYISCHIIAVLMNNDI